MGLWSAAILLAMIGRQVYSQWGDHTSQGSAEKEAEKRGTGTKDDPERR